MKTEEQVRMHARSLLRQARCPECGKRGMDDSEDCAWCDERNELTATYLLADSVHETEGKIAEDRRKLVHFVKYIANGGMSPVEAAHEALALIGESPPKTSEQSSAPSVAKQLSTEPSSSRSACEGSGPATVGAGPIRRLPQ